MRSFPPSSFPPRNKSLFVNFLKSIRNPPGFDNQHHQLPKQDSRESSYQYYIFWWFLQFHQHVLLYHSHLFYQNKCQSKTIMILKKFKERSNG
ncbi:hypothetical protein M153_12821000554, partial [Pseudoloma neurophilia]